MKERFGDLYDRNHGSSRDVSEVAAECGFSARLERWGDEDELSRAGIDPEKLGYMGSAERREILEGAGLDPDAYDF